MKEEEKEVQPQEELLDTEPKEDEWKLLAKRYDIRKEDYQNMEEYAERCKESIWDAIRKEDEYESNHNNTKCG